MDSLREPVAADASPFCSHSQLFLLLGAVATDIVPVSSPSPFRIVAQRCMDLVNVRDGIMPACCMGPVAAPVIRSAGSDQANLLFSLKIHSISKLFSVLWGYFYTQNQRHSSPLPPSAHKRHRLTPRRARAPLCPRPPGSPAQMPRSRRQHFPTRIRYVPSLFHCI